MSASLIWFLLGLGFAVAELAVPGLILVFFAVGCWVSSLAALLGIERLDVQIWIFIISSIVSLLAGRRFIPKTFRGHVRSNLAEDFDSEISGEIVEVTRDITPSVPGEVKFRGSFWKAMAIVEIRAGEKGIIIGTKDNAGSALVVGPVEQERSEEWKE